MESRNVAVVADLDGRKIVVNHTSNKKKYLYDILVIKKETSGSQHNV